MSVSEFLLYLTLLCKGVIDAVAVPGDFPVYPVLARGDDGESGRSVLRLGYLTGSRAAPGSGDFYNSPARRFSGAITLAVDEVNADPSVLPEHTLQFLVAEMHGQAAESVRQTVRLAWEGNVSAIIGPQEFCQVEAGIAEAFNLPMISHFCSDPALTSTKEYPTFVRTKPHDRQISRAVISTLLKFNWRKIAFVYNDRMTLLKDTLLEEYATHGITVQAQRSYKGPFFPKSVQNSPFPSIVEETYQSTRVYVMVAEWYEFEGLLSALKQRGLLDTGEYIVLGINPKIYDVSDPYKYVDGLIYSNRSQEIYDSYQALLLIVLSPPLYPGWVNFTATVNHYLEMPPFNFPNPFKHRNVMKILKPEAAYLYDAVWLYARAADAALRNGESPSDGKAIFNHLKGIRYKSAMGFWTNIDEEGEAQGNFTLLARFPAPDNASSPYGKYPVGVFLNSENYTNLPLLKLDAEAKIDWIGGWPPPDEPACGFQMEKCTSNKRMTSYMIGGITCGLIIILIVVGFAIYRYRRHKTIPYERPVSLIRGM